ncbi:MAG: hypothetical protein PQ975_11615 [Methanobacterium sp.]|jgi:hypothetical protein
MKPIANSLLDTKFLAAYVEFFTTAFSHIVLFPIIPITMSKSPAPGCLVTNVIVAFLPPI